MKNQFFCFSDRSPVSNRVKVTNLNQCFILSLIMYLTVLNEKIIMIIIIINCLHDLYGVLKISSAVNRLFRNDITDNYHNFTCSLYKNPMKTDKTETVSLLTSLYHINTPPHIHINKDQCTTHYSTNNASLYCTYINCLYLFLCLSKVN